MFLLICEAVCPFPIPKAQVLRTPLPSTLCPKWYMVLLWLMVTDTDMHAVLTLGQSRELLAPLTIPSRCQSHSFL